MCNESAELLTITKAARVANVSRRTVYNYIEEGLIPIVKIAGKTIRVCSSCLLRYSDSCEKIRFWRRSNGIIRAVLVTITLSHYGSLA